MRQALFVAGQLSLLLALAAAGQTSFSGSSGPNGFTGTATFSPMAFPVTQVTGAPYSGEQASEQVQTLADGTHITRKNSMAVKTWRDSQGRTRTERPFMMGSPTEGPVIVQITDPVAGYQYTLDSENHVAHRVALPSPQSARPPSAAAPGVLGGAISSGPAMAPGGGAGVVIGSGPTIVRSGSLSASLSAPRLAQQSSQPRTQFTTEPLGTRMINGVLCDGRRQTTTYPVDSQGNDRPFTVTSDIWTSQQLKLTVLSTVTDPRSGVSTNQIVNLSTAEPDPSLFQAPTGYTIVDETGTFTITYTSK